MKEPSQPWCVWAQDMSSYWMRAARRSNKEVIVFSPYLTSVRVFSALGPDVRIRVYTVFSIENFASGASSFSVLKRLRQRPNIEVRSILGLHAKVMVFDRTVFTIGSQNLTVKGTQNFEASVSSNCPESVEALMRKLQDWMRSSEPITDESMRLTESVLPRLKKLFQSFREETIACLLKIDEKLRAQHERQERRIATLREEVEKARKLFGQELAALEKALETVKEIGLSRGEAIQIANRCGWSAKSNKPMSDPVTHYLFRDDSLGWCWCPGARTGSNKFSISRAWLGLANVLTDQLRHRGWVRLDQDALKTRFIDEARSRVYNYIEEQYSSY